MNPFSHFTLLAVIRVALCDREEIGLLQMTQLGHESTHAGLGREESDALGNAIIIAKLSKVEALEQRILNDLASKADTQALAEKLDGLAQLSEERETARQADHEELKMLLDQSLQVASDTNSQAHMLKQNVDGASQKLDDLQDTADVTQGELSNVAADLRGVKGDLINVSTDMRGVKADVNDISAHMRGVKDDISDISADIRDVKEDLTNISADRSVKTHGDIVGNISVDLREVKEDVADVLSIVTDNRVIKEAIKEGLSNVSQKLDQVQGDVDELINTTADTNNVVKVTQTSDGVDNKLETSESESSCNAQDARNVLIIQGPGAAVGNFDLFGAIVSSNGGKVYKKLLDDLITEDFANVSTVILALQDSNASTANLALVSSWYSFDECVILIVTVNVGVSPSIIDDANTMLGDLAPATSVRLSANSVGPQTCSNTDVAIFQDPFYENPIPASGITSTSAHEVTGAGRALLSIGGTTIARLGNSGRLMVMGDVDILSDGCFDTWTAGNDAFAANVLNLALDLLPANASNA